MLLKLYWNSLRAFCFPLEPKVAGALLLAATSLVQGVTSLMVGVTIVLHHKRHLCYKPQKPRNLCWGCCKPQKPRHLCWGCRGNLCWGCWGNLWQPPTPRERLSQLVKSSQLLYLLSALPITLFRRRFAFTDARWLQLPLCSCPVLRCFRIYSRNCFRNYKNQTWISLREKTWKRNQLYQNSTVCYGNEINTAF